MFEKQCRLSINVSEKLQKILSRAGLGSRRAIEVLIAEGRVKVNNKIAKLGDRANLTDKISVNGRIVKITQQVQQKTRILLYNKPIGEISSRKDKWHNKTVFDNLPRIIQGRWIQVGRLDINTQGLLIFTTNGDFAHKLMHPSSNIEREYAVRVHGKVTQEILDNLLKGVKFEDGLLKFSKIEYRGGEGANSWYHVVLTEGKNREIRRLWQSQDLEVSRLIRIRFGDFILPRNLSRQEYVELNSLEVERVLKKIMGNN